MVVTDNACRVHFIQASLKEGLRLVATMMLTLFLMGMCRLGEEGWDAIMLRMSVLVQEGLTVLRTSLLVKEGWNAIALMVGNHGVMKPQLVQRVIEA